MSSISSGFAGAIFFHKRASKYPIIKEIRKRKNMPLILVMRNINKAKTIKPMKNVLLITLDSSNDFKRLFILEAEKYYFEK